MNRIGGCALFTDQRIGVLMSAITVLTALGTLIVNVEELKDENITLRAQLAAQKPTIIYRDQKCDEAFMTYYFQTKNFLEAKRRLCAAPLPTQLKP